MSNYKEIMNGKREIPISSCPAQIEDLLYGTGSVLHSQGDDSSAVFEITAEDLPKKKVKKAVKSKREEMLGALRKECGYDAVLTYCTVDTDNCFVYEGTAYRIDPSVEAYAPKHTALGVLYDMDKIICVASKTAGLVFYTMKYEPIAPGLVYEK